MSKEAQSERRPPRLHPSFAPSTGQHRPWADLVDCCPGFVRHQAGIDGPQLRVHGGQRHACTRFQAATDSNGIVFTSAYQGGDGVEATLERLKRPTSVDDLRRLGMEVRTHAEMLDEESLAQPHIDYELAQKIASAINSLIDDAPALDPSQRERLGAVARYFVLTEDESSDLAPDGLVDDASAVRELCLDLQRPDLASSI